jgi:hypothetical protein
MSPSGTSDLCGTVAGMVTPKGSISIGRESLQVFFCVLRAVAYLQVSPLDGSREETWHGQGIRKRSVSWNLPKLSLTTYVVQTLSCTVTTDSVLANSKTQNAFLFPVHATFRHDCHLAVKSASTPRRLVHKRKLGEIFYLLICSPSA